MKNFLLLLFVIVAVTGCSSSPSTIGEHASADSKAFEQISKQYEKGEKELEKGEKLISKGQKSVRLGKADIRDGELKIYSGNREIQSLRQAYSIKTGQEASEKIPDIFDNDNKDVKGIILRWENAEENVKKGNKLVISGNKQIKDGEKMIREGQSLVNSGKSLMSKAESKYKALK